MRFVTSDLDATKNVLTSLGTEFRIAEVLAVQIENGTGSLARVLERLAEEHINVEYAYASTTAAPGKALGIFHTSNPKRALPDLERGRERGFGLRAFGRPSSVALALSGPKRPFAGFERSARANRSPRRRFPP